jgi:hypothetical protein
VLAIAAAVAVCERIVRRSLTAALASLGVQVASYAFTFPDADDLSMQVRVMLPLFDLMNHADKDDTNINIMRDEEGNYIAYASRDIKKGEEVRSFNSLVLGFRSGMAAA